MIHKINFFGLKEEYNFLKKKIKHATNKVFKSGKYLQGQEVQKFEKNLSKNFKNNNIVAINSCTDGLFFCFKVLGFKEKSEILVTSFSFIVSMTSILRANLTPVFVDIDNNFNLDLNDAKKKISKKTKALVFVHLFGKSGDLKKIKAFCKKYKLELIEDIAQSFGAEYKKIKVGTVGRFSCISFDPTKTIAAPGSAGAVVCKNKTDYKKIKMLRYHGKNNQDFKILGYNSQMSEFAASILNEKIKYNNIWIKKRNLIANIYINNLHKSIIVPKISNDEIHAFSKFVVRVKKRDELCNYLQKIKIPYMIHYKKLLYDNNIVKKNFYCKNSNQISKEVLSLPIHPFLKIDQVKNICKKINFFINSHNYE